MSRSRDKHRAMADINVVPYIDVMLVLLIIFMVTAPMLMQGVQVDLPTADADPVENQDSEPLIISVDSAGRWPRLPSGWVRSCAGARRNRCWYGGIALCPTVRW